MTPDMKRLTEAARSGYNVYSGMDRNMKMSEAAAIVHAVLMELRDIRKLSDDTLDAADHAATDGARKSVNSRMLAMAKRGREAEAGLAPYEWLAPSFAAMIDQILSDPT